MKKEAPESLRSKNLLVNDDKTEGYKIYKKLKKQRLAEMQIIQYLAA